MPNNIYNNPEDRDFKLSYWVVTNRVYLRTMGILALAVVCGGLFLLGVGGLFKYSVLDRQKNLDLETAITKTNLNYALLAEVSHPKELQVVSTRVFQPVGGSADFVAEVVNPNTEWTVESFDYYFEFGADKTNVKTDFILPDQTKYVLSLNFQTPRTVNIANLKIENVKWRKVPNYKDLADKFNQFDFQNITVLSSKKSGLSEKGAVANIRFDILNKTPASFWEPRFIILMYQRKDLVGVSQVVLNDLKTGEKRTESFNLFQDLSDNIQIEIVPDINILDPNVFRSFDNSSGELK